MRVTCRPSPLQESSRSEVVFSLFAQPESGRVGRVAASLPLTLARAGLKPDVRTWDFLTLALSVAAADQGVPRGKSSDGWTRQIELDLAVNEPGFWESQRPKIEAALSFLTGDIWNLRFDGGGYLPPEPSPRSKKPPDSDCVCLLSGGVDSLVGAIDLVSRGQKPVLVSHIVRGDADNQRSFAGAIGDGLFHLQLGHGISTPFESETSQRARSMVFVAYGLLAAAEIRQADAETVDLVMPENGFISINVPLTPLRIGSLSTRTTHPYFLKLIQSLLDCAGFQVRIVNPYFLKTKGEMLKECSDQELLRRLVFNSTSCGRYARTKYTHCGRCVPCLVRRSAFHKWAVQDRTDYKFYDLSRKDDQHRDFDDVRSVAFAIKLVAEIGIQEWAGAAVSTELVGDVDNHLAVAKRGLEELADFLEETGTL